MNIQVSQEILNEVKLFLNQVGMSSPTSAQITWANEIVNGCPLYHHFSTKKRAKAALDSTSVALRIIARVFEDKTKSLNNEG